MRWNCEMTQLISTCCCLTWQNVFLLYRTFQHVRVKTPCCCDPRWGYHFKIDLVNSCDFCVLLKPLLVPSSTGNFMSVFFVNWCDGMNLISSKDFHELPGCLSVTEPVVAIWNWQRFCSARCQLIQGFHYLCFRQDEHLPFWGCFQSQQHQLVSCFTIKIPTLGLTHFFW